MVSKYMIAVSYRKPYTRRRVRTVWGQTLWKPTVERRQGAECRAYHCTLLPIKDGRFAFKKLFAGKDKYEYSAKMKQLHSDFAEVNAKWGMSRGTSVAETGARHRSTEEYRRHLSEQCTTIGQQIVQHKKALSDLNKEIDIARRRVS